MLELWSQQGWSGSCSGAGGGWSWGCCRWSGHSSAAAQSSLVGSGSGPSAGAAAMAGVSSGSGPAAHAAVALTHKGRWSSFGGDLVPSWLELWS